MLSTQPLIFIIDKNESYRSVVTTCLNSMGLNNFRTFDNGENCFTSSSKGADLIILDYNLGEGNWNGIEFMEEYDRHTAGANFLFLSSNSKVEIAVETISKGAYDYIIKSKKGLSRLANQVKLVNAQIQGRQYE